jgi:hypothetical protein
MAEIYEDAQQNIIWLEDYDAKHALEQEQAVAHDVPRVLNLVLQAMRFKLGDEMYDSLAHQDWAEDHARLVT